MNETGIRISFKEDIINFFTSQNVLVPVKTTKKGNTSIDDSVLEKIQHPHAKEIQRARKLKTWIDNYIVKMLENDDNGVIRPHINPLGGEDVGRTGRMSCNDPALYAIEKDAIIRDCIVARPGHKLIHIDYRNEELRIIASLCNSKGMIEAFEQDLDMHKQTAARMYGITIDQVTDKQKTNAKRAMFTLGYGGKEKTFAAYMGLGYDEGARYFESLYALYPELPAYLEDQKQVIKANKVGDYGHIILSDGRRSNIPANKSFTAVSYRSQGEGSILLKRKLIDMDAAGLGDYLRLPEHDAVALETPAEDAEEVARTAVELMEDHTTFRVPLTCDFEIMDKYGDNVRTEVES